MALSLLTSIAVMIVGPVVLLALHEFIGAVPVPHPCYEKLIGGTVWVLAQAFMVLGDLERSRFCRALAWPERTHYAGATPHLWDGGYRPSLTGVNNGPVHFLLLVSCS